MRMMRSRRNWFLRKCTCRDCNIDSWVDRAQEKREAEQEIEEEQAFWYGYEISR